jgi:hypothetical protein
LFHTDDPNANPEVLTLFTTDNLSANSYSFLKQEDRKLMERAYEYATANGLDPVQVDNLAFDLANYRFLQVTGNNTGEITGTYDSEGNPWVGKFNAQDAEQAKRILTNPAIETTDLDKGFLATLLNPQISGLHHAVSFNALEKFISGLSSSDNSQSIDNATKPSQPTAPSHPALAQALYRIDHPYVGAKWDSSKSHEDKSDNLPWQHLSKADRKQLMEAYQFSLLHGSDSGLKFLEQMSTLTGIARMQQDGSLNSGPLTKATIGHGALFQSLSQQNPSGDSQEGTTVTSPHIDTST